VSEPVVPAGTRIQFIAHGEPDPAPLTPGEEGTVTGGNADQIWVDWDSGRSLCLLPGIDRFRVLNEGDRALS
jgi:Domain of unknown function (DUF4314)